MVSPLHANGTPWSGAADREDVGIARTRRLHERAYPELVDGDRARLLVLGCEVFGRWAPEVRQVLKVLCEHKAKEAPELLRRSATLAWHRRWMGLLSVAAQTALAESLLAPTSPHLTEIDADPPALGDLLVDHRDAEPPEISRLPLR